MNDLDISKRDKKVRLINWIDIEPAILALRFRTG
ncbi:MAG: hypothetical protein ACI88H_003958 [Cocleimonas sp.]